MEKAAQDMREEDMNSIPPGLFKQNLRGFHPRFTGAENKAVVEKSNILKISLVRLNPFKL